MEEILSEAEKNPYPATGFDRSRKQKDGGRREDKGETDGQKPEQITLSLGQVFASDKKRREYHCRFVKAGRIRRAGNSPSNIVIEASALQAAVMEAKFDARAVFVDHAGLWEGPAFATWPV